MPDQGFNDRNRKAAQDFRIRLLALPGSDSEVTEPTAIGIELGMAFFDPDAAVCWMLETERTSPVLVEEWVQIFT